MTSRSVGVLLVDDVAGLRRLVRIALEDDDTYFRIVAEASNGLEAVEEARKTRPDIVLLDVSMPVMDGLEALPLIREASPRSKVIMFTGFSKERLGSTTRDLGAVEYLEKGATPIELRRRLKEVMGHA